ncbi:MAG: type II CRISPR RNA-guided endonuclease Cas9, partial [Lachnospiraceae bacterium]|nr:type II CRISPR RNA-guided endonuclease Cas9 [Lachnospiraceae bacterium]
MEAAKKDYFIGLDIGTGSVGWAVTDTEYHILRAKGKDMWGARLFDEAKPAAKRRKNRISRRRRAREKARIGILKELLEPEIVKVDPGFFHRLDESKYYLDDRTGDNAGQKYAIFAKGSTGEVNYTDIDYYRQYPTIFHLRTELIHSTEKHDIRLVYLALLNMFKHRGHFLNDTLSTEDDGLGFEDSWRELMSSYETCLCASADEEEAEKTSAFSETADINSIREILLSKEKSRTQILEESAEKLGITKRNKPEYELLRTIIGLTGKPENIFGKKDTEEKLKGICFRKSSFEEDFDTLIRVLSEEETGVVLAAKAVHDALLLDEIKGASTYISEARVAAYEEHQADLKLLKRTIKRLAPEKYDTLFREIGDGSYSAYVGSTCTGKGKKVRRFVTNHSTSVNNSDPEE